MNEKRSHKVKDVIQQLHKDFTSSHNPNSRKGGLIGLAACAIALGNQVKSFLLYRPGLPAGQLPLNCQSCVGIRRYLKFRMIPNIFMEGIKSLFSLFMISWSAEGLARKQ